MGNKIRFRFFKKIHCRILGHNWNKELLDIEVQINPTTRRFFFGTRVCWRCKFGIFRLIVDVFTPQKRVGGFPPIHGFSPDWKPGVFQCQKSIKDQDIIAEERPK